VLACKRITIELLLLLLLLCFQKGKTSSVGNYRPLAILNNFIIHGHVSHFLKSKLNSFQRGFINLNLPLPI
jgi:hypothetical protein